MIERASKDPEINIDKLQRLLDMRAQEYARIAILHYSEAMTACQAAMEAIRTDCANSQTRSRYASLAALDAAARPIYTRHGFSLSYDTEDCPKSDHVRVVCQVRHAGGHAETPHIDMPADGKGKGAKGGDVMTRTHATGSAISYGRRYLLGMVFNLCVEKDDDGNAAGRTQRRPTPQAARPTQGKHADGQDNRFYHSLDAHLNGPN
jgi:ERF superfamily